MKQKIVFCGVINMHTGYGQHSAKIVSGLEKDYDVYIRAIEISQSVGKQKTPVPGTILRHLVHREQQEPWELLLYPPKRCPTHRKKTAYFTMWESTRLSRQAVEMVNRAEVVIVPCQWNKLSFIASGINKPIRLVPLGIDTNFFRYIEPKPSERFVFGCAGRIAHGDKRKGLKDVVAAFKAAFPPKIKDVVLSVKGFQDCPIEGGEDKRIELNEKYFEPKEYVNWLSTLDCFVSAARSEGWGWHQQEAMAVGRPLIACRYGGLAEFFNSSGGICLSYSEEPAEEVWEGLGDWARPNFDYMVESMRWMYQNRQTAAIMGKNASRLATKFSNEYAHTELEKVLKEFGVVK